MINFERIPQCKISGLVEKKVENSNYSKRVLVFAVVEFGYKTLPVCFLRKATVIVIRMMMKSNEVPILEFLLRSNVIRSNMSLIPTVGFICWSIHQNWQKSRVKKMKKSATLFSKINVSSLAF